MRDLFCQEYIGSLHVHWLFAEEHADSLFCVQLQVVVFQIDFDFF